MKLAPIPKNEKKRLISLHKLGLLDTPNEKRFDQITKLATRIFNAPISTLTLVDSRREWFKSCQGLNQHEGDRAISFCGHALLDPDVFVVPDTKKDSRFADNPMVTGKPFIRFYAGVPLISGDGNRIGVFCIKDTKPRKFTKYDEHILKSLASWAEVEINSHNLILALNQEKKTSRELINKTKLLEDSRKLETKSKDALMDSVKELERAKAIISLEKAKDEAMLTSIGDGVVAVDIDRKIILVNRALGNMLGYKPADLIGKSFTDLPFEDEAGVIIPLRRRPLTIAFKNGRVVNATYYFRRNKNKRLAMSITVTPIILKGKIVGVIETARDVTHEKEIDRAKSEFVSLASHQLRTPPTTIKWYAEMLEQGGDPLTKKQREFLGEIQKGNQRMIALVNSLLNVSRMEAGSFDVAPEKTYPFKLLQDLVKEFQHRIDGKKLALKLVGDTSMSLFTDPKLLQIVMENLITNAIKYTPNEGKIQIECGTKQAGEFFGKQKVLVDCFTMSVRDTGYGIPINQQDKIFTKLFRADNVKARDTDGTGLGLYLVKLIVDYCHGNVWFDSRENKGTTFFVFLPKKAQQKRKGNKKLILGNSSR
jgi:PAS domain S-box-containing protein